MAATLQAEVFDLQKTFQRTNVKPICGHSRKLTCRLDRIDIVWESDYCLSKPKG
jgi:hypothetical protein